MLTRPSRSPWLKKVRCISSAKAKHRTARRPRRLCPNGNAARIDQSRAKLVFAVGEALAYRLRHCPRPPVQCHPGRDRSREQGQANAGFQSRRWWETAVRLFRSPPSRRGNNGKGSPRILCRPVLEFCAPIVRTRPSTAFRSPVDSTRAPWPSPGTSIPSNMNLALLSPTG
jgi:hypothetical protein